MRGNCGVSVCRSGEAMEPALRQCCRSVRICKILLGEEQRVVYARFCPDIAKRRVLLLYPIVTYVSSHLLISLLSTGNTLIKAVRILEDNGVSEENIYILTIFCTPSSKSSSLNSPPFRHQADNVALLVSRPHHVGDHHRHSTKLFHAIFWYRLSVFSAWSQPLSRSEYVKVL